MELIDQRLSNKEVELTRATWMQVPPEAVGLDLGGFRPDPVLGPPGLQAVAPEGSGGLGEGAEERVDAEAVGDELVRPVARVRDPGQVRGPDVLGVGDLDQALLRQVPARGSPPLPETPPHLKARDQPHLLQFSHPVLAPSKGPEAKA
jgi:hypothetical protein